MGGGLIALRSSAFNAAATDCFGGDLGVGCLICAFVFGGSWRYYKAAKRLFSTAANTKR